MENFNRQLRRNSKINRAEKSKGRNMWWQDKWLYWWLLDDCLMIIWIWIWQDECWPLEMRERQSGANRFGKTLKTKDLSQSPTKIMVMFRHFGFSNLSFSFGFFLSQISQSKSLYNHTIENFQSWAKKSLKRHTVVNCNVLETVSDRLF